jgi:LysR family transcriptional regulator, regulator for metE and metH
MRRNNSLVELEIRHLKLIDAIAGTGTMTRAAARLYITQSALSHQLAGLEESLGVTLFKRVPRGMVLTPHGEKLLDTARSVLRDLREAAESLASADAEGQGTLRLSTECYTCYHWLPSRLKEFHARFPKVEVEIVVEATRRPVEALVHGELDLAIVSDRQSQAGLNCRVLFEDELVAILSPQHRLAARRWLAPRDFANERLITYAVPPRQLYVFQEFFDPAGVAPARISRVELTEAIVELVKANLGIAIMARWAAARHLKEAALKAVPLTRQGLRRKWYAVTVKPRRPAAALDAFVDLLAAKGAFLG